MSRLAVAILLFALSSIARGETPPGADRLAWLAGHWMAEQGGRWTEETWTAPRGGLLLGVNRSGRGGSAEAFEFLRIAAGDDGRLTYWAAPGGAPATAFVLSEVSTSHAVFENPAHDYPVRIEYRRDGDVLVATVSGKDGTNPMQWRFSRPVE